MCCDAYLLTPDKEMGMISREIMTAGKLRTASEKS